MPKHRKFIDKKNSVTYQVINCPAELAYEENASKTIWIPKDENSSTVAYPSLDLKKNKLPERIFPTKGPRPDWDPDVVAALDEDFDYNDPSNILDDDFIAKAGALKISDGKEKLENEDDESDSNIDSDDLFSDNESVDELTKSLFKKAIAKEKKKATASQYTMTSAVSNCSESIKTFNERFEKILESYGDDEIGALDGEDIEGHYPDESELLEELCREKPDEELQLGNYEETLKSFILNYIERAPKEKYVEVVTKQKPEFDCESILSTYSNIYNHPEVIKVETKKKPKTSEQSSLFNLMNKNSNNKEDDEDSEEESDSGEEEESNERCSAVCSVRQKNETPEDRRDRKKLLKQARREQRMLKKENKMAFKNAKKKISQDEINLQRSAGVKIL